MSGDSCSAMGAPHSPRTPLRRLGSSRKLNAFASLRASLGEQARVVEGRAEAAAGAAAELSEHCRRRAELEAEYARAMEKLARAADGPEDSAGGAALAACSRHARVLAKEHGALAALYGGPLANRAARAAEHAARLARRAKEMLLGRQEELATALLSAAGSAKAHGAAAAAWRLHATKLRDALQRRDAQLAADPAKAKKLRALDKELDKRRARHAESRARALLARHEHALSLEEANAAMQRYYLDDVADIMLCTEVGYSAAVSRVCRTAAAAEGALAAARGEAAAALGASAALLGGGAAAARRRLLAAHPAFAAPAAQPPPPDHCDAVRALIGEAAAEEDASLASARQQLSAARVQYESLCEAARLHCQEAAKTLDAAEAELVRQMEGCDVDVSKLFGAGAGAGAGAVAGAAGALAGDASVEDTPRRDQEDYYLAKVRAYVSRAGRVSQLEARAAAAAALLGGSGGGGGGGGAGGGSHPLAWRGGREGRGPFSAPLPVDAVPAVLSGCVRVIAGHGLSAQGIFRVSGAHAEVSALRAALERGQQPLASCGAGDVHAVCTLLKLWLRSLRPPLLPPALHAPLLAARDAPAAELRAALGALPPPHMIALRYLCAFLAHLSLHCARTRMDAWNLAICLGPTLLVARGAPAAQVAAQNALNHLLKRLIVQHHLLFPQEVSPHTLFVPPPPPPPEQEACPPELCTLDPDASDAPLPLPLGLHDDLSLYADDDEEAISEEDSIDWGGSDPPTPAEWGGRGGGSPVPIAPATPVVPAAPQRAPPPAPPPRCESRTRIADTLQALQLQPAPCAPTAPGAPSAGQPPPLSSPEPPLTPCDETAAASMSCERAPDLVQGLPPLGVVPPVDPPSPSRPPDADPADAFAHNSDTLKKRPPLNRPSPPQPPPAPQPAEAAPAPAPPLPPVRPPTPL